MDLNNVKIAVIGLGYVGLPLAIEFGKKYVTIGFDINQRRVNELLNGYDHTLEIESEELAQSTYLTFSSDEKVLEQANVYIVTVPTPINDYKQPDLIPLIKASEIIGKSLKEGDIVIYESTVYPGATEEECVPVLENSSGLIFNKDFFAGYSPERINPGDKEHRVANICKVTSGSTPIIADFIDDLYGSIIIAGTHKAASIKIAEAAKIIENVQRDVNIALVNELHQIFKKLDIPTRDVIDAAATKWNFMKLMPGLVGGHCISVDPYYLLHRSVYAGYIPDMMRKAREINDNFSSFIVDDFIKTLINKRISLVGIKIVVLGYTFKENCPDTRNTKVKQLVLEMQKLGLNVVVYDPLISIEKNEESTGVRFIEYEEIRNTDVGLLAVPHDKIIDLILSSKIQFKYLYDFKDILDRK